MDKNPAQTTLAILGGTGKEGKGLALRWAKTGYRILIGSRSIEKALLVVDEIKNLLGDKILMEGVSNLVAARQADIIALTVPYFAHRQTLEEVKDALIGKILIGVTVPLNPLNVAKVQMPAAGSAAQEAAEILGADVHVASAFQNISHELLYNSFEAIDGDVLVSGTSSYARIETLKLVSAAGLTGWDAGPIENSAVVEGLTSILIGLNRRYGSKSAGIRIVGVKAQSWKP
jgi:NADPH-dependent F420 reductase